MLKDCGWTECVFELQKCIAKNEQAANECLKKDRRHFELKKSEKMSSCIYSLTCLPVEIFERWRVGPLPASMDVQVIEADPQSSAVTCQ